jgi:hypothetical protein
MLEFVVVKGGGGGWDHANTPNHTREERIDQCSVLRRTTLGHGYYVGQIRSGEYIINRRVCAFNYIILVAWAAIHKY